MRKSPSEGVETKEAASQVLLSLGRRLNEAGSVRRTAEIILEVADELLGWDVCSLNLYSPELDAADCVLAMDLIDGRRTEVTGQNTTPSPKMRKILSEGAQMVLRGGTPQFGPDLNPVGDKSRPSASLLFAPLRGRKRVIGVLTIQSYTPEAYVREDLDVLEVLADYCAGAIERIQTEGLLRRTEELYRRAIGGAGAVPYAYDYRTRSYSFIGEGIEQLTGYSPREINGEVWFRIIQESAMTGEAAGLNKNEAARRVEKGELRHWTCDMRILTRDGKSRWLSDASVQNLDEAGRVIGSMGILEDITERKEAEIALRQSESQLRLVWESSADGMRLTNRDGTMLRVNEAYCRMVQKSRGELEGQLLTTIHSQQNAEFVLDSYRHRVDSNTLAPHLETEVTLWNGVKVWFELSNSLLEVPGKPPLVLSVFRDVTSRKQTEAQLAQMHQQLLEVSRQAGMAEVATSVLHNVGNVLNSVNVSSSLIADKVRASKAPSLAKAVALLQEHGSDLAAFLTTDSRGRQLPAYLGSLADHLNGEQQDLLQELKSLAHNIDHIKEIVAMQQSYARVLGVVESLPVVDLVEDALRLNAGAMERHQVKVIREYFEVPPILVDKHKVLQILVNLIRNAKYALDDKGHADKRLVLQVGMNGNNMVKISVLDNGIGIPPENLTRVFEHGFTTRKEGHGFGLHNGALAAKELGGSLTAFSDGPGKGARFTLELPRRPRERNAGTEFRGRVTSKHF